MLIKFSPFFCTHKGEEEKRRGICALLFSTPSRGNSTQVRSRLFHCSPASLFIRHCNQYAQSMRGMVGKRGRGKGDREGGKLFNSRRQTETTLHFYLLKFHCISQYVCVFGSKLGQDLPSLPFPSPFPSTLSLKFCAHKSEEILKEF